MTRTRPWPALAAAAAWMCCSGMAGSPAFAVAPTVSPGEPLTPDGAVAIAVARHPSLAASAVEIDAARAERDLARSGWLPRIVLEEDITRSTNPTFVFASKLGQESFTEADFAVEALNRPEPLTNAATRVILRQNIWDAGRTNLHGEAADRGVEASESGHGRTGEAVAFQARRAFWDAVLAEGMLESAGAGERAAEENARLATARAEEGLAVPSDRMQAEVRLAEVRALRFRAIAGVETARAALRVALGLSEDVAFTLDPPEVVPDDAPAQADELVAQALGARADLAALAARAGQAEVGERVARSGRVPEIGLGAQYEWNADRPFGNDGENWTVGATARWTVYDGSETKARVARARADRGRIDAHRRMAEEGARLEVRSALSARTAAAERLRAAESALGSSGEALRIVRERYEEGLAVMVELLGAEAAHTATRSARVEAARDLAVARAALDFAVGRSDPAAVSTTKTTTGDAR